MIRVAIVDDQSLMREGLKTILSTYDDLDIVAIGGNGKEAVTICRDFTIDVLLMDIRMPEMTGVEAVKEIKRFNKSIKIIMLTTFDDEEYILNAIANGANGYLFKDIEYTKLVENIREVYHGQYTIEPKVAWVLAQKLIGIEKKNDELKNFQFTSRELEIFKMIKNGLSNKQIASHLFISEGTVKNYISNIYNKTGVNDRETLVELLEKIL